MKLAIFVIEDTAQDGSFLGEYTIAIINGIWRKITKFNPTTMRVVGFGYDHCGGRGLY